MANGLLYMVREDFKVVVQYKHVCIMYFLVAILPESRCNLVHFRYLSVDNALLNVWKSRAAATHESSLNLGATIASHCTSAVRVSALSKESKLCYAGGILDNAFPY